MNETLKIQSLIFIADEFYPCVRMTFSSIKLHEMNYQVLNKILTSKIGNSKNHQKYFFREPSHVIKIHFMGKLFFVCLYGVSEIIH